jgi:ribose 5-phosphate isomerase A
MTTDTSLYKQQAADRAVEFVQSGMVLGLGTGSTAIFATRKIGERLQRGELRDIIAIATSEKTAAAARELGIPLMDDSLPHAVDLTIDGADEVDPDLNLIKGGGGALFREKLVAQASHQHIVVADESKRSPALGTLFALPVEVTPFGWRAQERFLSDLGAVVTLRQTDGVPFNSDQGNFIVDCAFGPLSDPVALATQLDARTGILEHGLFIGIADVVIFAGAGGIITLTRKTGV